MTLRKWMCLAIVGSIVISQDGAFAQITPDSTLGAENSKVTSPTSGTFLINGGATRGTNLFHSFSQFSVPTNGLAHFNNDLSIQNIISRVTGTSVSNIDGTLQTNGTANLFLINPNGILFGPNSSLNVGGSFLATTANAIQFGNQGFFSATTPNVPPLLTINPSALLFNQTPSGKINSQSIAPAGVDPTGSPTFGLRVPDGSSLLLVGGDINVDGLGFVDDATGNTGGLKAFGGRVELAGVSETGTVRLNGEGSNLSLSIPDGVARANVSLTNGAEVNVRAGSGGYIAINSQNLEILGGSKLRAGIASGLGATDAQAGDITLDTLGEVKVDGADSQGNPGGAFNNVLQSAMGKGGAVNVTTGSLYVTNGAELVANLSGQGEAGNVNINARDVVSFAGVDINGNPSGVFTSVTPTGMGRGGSINIQAGAVAVTNGAELQASTAGTGDAGNITIQVRDRVSLDGVFEGTDSNGNPSFAPSFAESLVEPGAIGNGGDISITTGSLFVTNRANLGTSTFGQGNAGNVTIRAKDSVVFDGADNNHNFSSVFTTVDTDTSTNSVGMGKGGNIDIQAPSLTITNGAALQALTRGEGNAGNIQINTSASVNLSGVSPSGSSSGLISSSEATANGQGGDITVTTGSLQVANGAVISARTRSASPGGNITVNSKTLELTGGGEMVTTAFNSGTAGNITINTSNNVTISGSDPTYTDRVNQFGIATVDPVSAASGLFATTTDSSTGQGGTIIIDPNRVTVNDGATIAVNSEGTGNAGGIQIGANYLTLDNGQITSETKLGEGGDIKLDVENLLLLRHQSLISTTAGNNQNGGNGGNITINTPFIVTVSQENSDISADAFKGNGGTVNITAQGIFGTQFEPKRTSGSDITASSNGGGINGVVIINTPGVDPSHGLVTLPAQVVDNSQRIAQGCDAGGGTTGSQFAVTGRGGLPPNPGEVLSSDVVWEDSRISPARTHHHSSETTTKSPSEEIASIRMVPATGWVFNNKGEVTLIAFASNANIRAFGATQAPCHGPQK